MAEAAKEDVIAKKRVITPVFRVSYPSVFKASKFGDQDEKFSVTMLFPKDADLKQMKAAYLFAAEEKFGKDKDQWPEGFRSPFRDGDKKKDKEGYQGCIFVKASSKQPPGLVDQSREPILSEKDFYAGCYARAEVIAFAYKNKGVGVSFSLMNIQKIKDGKAFSGRKEAKDVFDSVEKDSDDESNYSKDDDDLGI
jgi:hypothetical protein